MESNSEEVLIVCSKNWQKPSKKSVKFTPFLNYFLTSSPFPHSLEAHGERVCEEVRFFSQIKNLDKGWSEAPIRLFIVGSSTERNLLLSVE